jgi:hypothetical protein
MLMHDDAAQLFHMIRNPDRVLDAQLQLPRLVTGRVGYFQIAVCVRSAGRQDQDKNQGRQGSHDYFALRVAIVWEFISLGA